MKVIVARTAGFCWGVRRAMDAVLEASARQDGRVQTLGPLIHNPQALELIGKRGVTVASSPDKVESGTVVIRAHGIPIQDLRGLKERQAEGELRIVNATCPEVAKVHSKIKKWSPKGYFTVILGIHGHAESMAHQSFAEHGSAIVANMAEAEALTDAQVEKLLVVAQTTYTVKDFHDIAEYLRARSRECIIENTICEDTWTRQEEARNIATSVDAVVVVGGKNSANTRHLVELAEHHGKPVQYVETASELDLARFSGQETVGVLAGASTPTWLVEEVVDVLEHHGSAPGLLSRATQEVLGAPALLGAGAALTCLGMTHWLGLPFRAEYLLIAFGYVMAMFTLTPYLDSHGLGVKGPAQARFLVGHRGAVLTLGALSFLVGVVAAFRLGRTPGLVVLIASMLGAIYKLSIPFFRSSISLRNIPGSKDVLVALALPAVLIGVPVLHSGRAWDGAVWSALVFVGALGLARTGIQNLKEMQKDRIMGRETFPILFGRAATRNMLAIALVLGWLGMSGVILSGSLQAALVLIPLLGVIAAFPILHLWLFHERFTVGRSRFEPPVELAFFLVGVMALTGPLR